MGLDEIFQEIKMEEKGENLSEISSSSRYKEWEEVGVMSHLDSVRNIEIFKNYLISSGDDCLIKLWDISNP